MGGEGAKEGNVREKEMEADKCPQMNTQLYHHHPISIVQPTCAEPCHAPAVQITSSGDEATKDEDARRVDVHRPLHAVAPQQLLAGGEGVEGAV